MSTLRSTLVLMLVAVLLGTTSETRELQNGGSSVLPPPVSTFVKYEGPPDPNLESWYLIPTCSSVTATGADGKKATTYRGNIEFWSVDGQKPIYTLGGHIPTSRQYGRAEDVWLHCRESSVTKRSPASFPKVPPREILESEKASLVFDWRIWGDCQRVSEGKRIVIPPSMNGQEIGFPVLEYHAENKRSSPILWKVDLRDWRLKDGSQLTCRAGQLPWTE